MAAPDGSKTGIDSNDYTTMYNGTGIIEAVEDGGLTLVIKPDVYFNTYYPLYVSGGEIDTPLNLLDAVLLMIEQFQAEKE